jgi:predicted PurR-regulated permease PerM
MGMERRLIEPLFFVAILLGTIVVAFLMFRPFLYTLVFAGVLAYLTHGIYVRMLRKLGSPTWTALLLTLLVVFALLIPLTLIGLRIAYEASGLYTYIGQQATQEHIVAGLSSLQQSLDHILPGVQVDATRVISQLSNVLGWLIGNLGALVSSFAVLVVQFVLLLMFYYYLVRDGAHLTDRLKELSPLATEKEDQIIFRIGRALTATVRGSLLMAALHGIVAGSGYLLFGIPSPVLWGIVTMLAAFVPTLGTALVEVPAVLFLLLSGHWGLAICLAVWAIVLHGFLDNVVAPKLYARGTRMHPLVMLLAIFGGIAFYGPLGVLLGPITISILYALLDIYQSVIQAPAK